MFIPISCCGVMFANPCACSVTVSDPNNGFVVRAQAHLVGSADLALLAVPQMRFRRLEIGEYFHECQPIFHVGNVNLPAAILRRAWTLPARPTLTGRVLRWISAEREGPPYWRLQGTVWR